MNETSQSELCPCDSGLEFDVCCGVNGRRAVDAEVMLRLDAEGNIVDGKATPQLQVALDTLGSNPDLFPARINFADGKAWFVKMSPQWYRESVFLDPARIKGTYVVETVLPWLQTITDQIPWQPTSFIFHTAFCGSTLMAQALEALYHCLPLREPETVVNIQYFVRNQNIPEATREEWFGRVMRLLSRHYEPQQSVVVKVNDCSNPVMIDLLDWDQTIPMLFMYTPLDEFVASCVKAPSRIDWIQDRYNSIRPMLPMVFGMDDLPTLEPTAHGELAAMYWSYNIAILLIAMESGSNHLRTLDFNDMLKLPLDAIQACGQLLGLQPLANVDVQAEVDRLFGIYSKNSSYRYSPEQRRVDIERALANNQGHLHCAETLARQLLGDAYPSDGLPGSLI